MAGKSGGSIRESKMGDPTAIVRAAVGLACRNVGFAGGKRASTWTFVGERDDTALVNVQTRRGLANSRLVAIELAVVPSVWFEWSRRDFPSSERDRRKQGTADGLFRDRLLVEDRSVAAGALDGWFAVSDEESAQRASDDIVRQLTDGRLSTLQRLTQRSEMIEAVRGDRLGRMGAGSLNPSMQFAVLLADEGDSLELRQTVGAAIVGKFAAQDLEEWVRLRLTSGPR
jgi:hypothetical protein